MNTEQRIYLDNSAATPLDSRVYKAMEPYWLMHIGNAGGLHQEGQIAKDAIATARKQVAVAIDVKEDEIICTSGGTEANNLAIVGRFLALRKQGVEPAAMHMVTTAIEHSSVRDCYKQLETYGVQTSYVPVDQEGYARPEDIAAACTDQTVLVSVMYVSNEIGTVMQLPAIRRALNKVYEQKRELQPLFHTDASQAPAWLDCTSSRLGVDLMTLDAQKVYGPKGAGCLYRRHGVVLEPVLFGGNQEFGLRPGTPPTPLIVGMGQSLAYVQNERGEYLERVRKIRDVFVDEVLKQVPQAELNGPPLTERLPNNVNLSFPGLESEQIVFALDHVGVAASTRSACLFGDKPGSYVIRALEKGEAYATSSIRFSLSRYTTEEQIMTAAQHLIDVVTQLYQQSKNASSHTS
jgi:cysteine desulfurase